MFCGTPVEEHCSKTFAWAWRGLAEKVVAAFMGKTRKTILFLEMIFRTIDISKYIAETSKGEHLLHCYS